MQPYWLKVTFWSKWFSNTLIWQGEMLLYFLWVDLMLSNISYCFSTRPSLYKTPLHCQDLPVLSISTKARWSWKIHYDHRTMKLLKLYPGWFLQASALDMEHKVWFPVSAAASSSILSLCSASIIDSFILQSNVPANIKQDFSRLLL